MTKKILIFFITLSACNSVYFSALEKIGIEKRDLMISRIKNAKESQIEAKEQFKDALEQYKSIIKFQGGTLEDKYQKLSSVLEKSEEKATEVKSRISSVRDVSVALFKEWKNELNQYSDQRLRSDSEKKLQSSKDEYSRMMASMRIAADKLDPALKPLKDNVLYLKHNLNAKAISALDTEVHQIESKVEDLIIELNQAIDDANSYINTLEQK